MIAANYGLTGGYCHESNVSVQSLHRTGLRSGLRRMRRWLALQSARLYGREIVHFLHVPKTGGTAVAHALSWQRPGTGHHVIFHSHAITLRDIPVGEKFVFFLRDPAQRFVSAFNSRRNCGRPRYNVPWNEAERSAFARFRSANELALALSEPGREADAREALQGIRLVQDSYLDWFDSEAYLSERLSDLLLAGFQESLELDFARLCQRLGYPPRTVLPTDPVQAHRGPSGAERELTGQAVANLRRHYRRDYEFLDYCKTLQSPARSQGRHLGKC